MFIYTFLKQLGKLSLCIPIFTASYASFGCDLALPPWDFGLGNTIFPGTELVETLSPAFNDTISILPTFAWRATGKKFVYLGLFTENISVRNNEIVNISDNIWAWHSGLGKGREGNVQYQDGVEVINGELQEGKEPPPLESGEYSWAVWAWSDDGIDVTHSSEEMFFVFEKSNQNQRSITLP